MIKRPENIYDSYHAHVYFGSQTVAEARALCEEASRLFGIQMGRVHERPVGPHPEWSCQLSFDSTQFERVIPWLDAHRGPLDVFVHGQTGDALADHTTHASWLGNAYELKLDMFR